MKSLYFSHQRKIQQYLKERESEREQKSKSSNRNPLFIWECAEVRTVITIPLRLGRRKLDKGLSYMKLSFRATASCLPPRHVPMKF